MNTSQRGFTIIELLVIIVILSAASILFFMQKGSIEVAQRDAQRKTAINAMYYSLEEVFYKTNGYYPHSINSEVLPAVDPDLFKDPNGVKIGEAQSNYRYEGIDCENDKCSRYSLRTTLENEADFVKTNRVNR